MDWVDGRLSLEDSVSAPRSVTGRALRDAFLAAIPRYTFGLVRSHGTVLAVGPVELLRFGAPKVTRNAVEWPIEGGLSARSAGGTWRLEWSGGRLSASITGYRPMLPRAIYVLAHLPIHALFARLFLLDVRGREPAPGPTATESSRLQAAAIDVAFCAALTGLVARRPRVRLMLGVLAGYHVMCWSTTGQTLGGMVLKQRVVASDGGRVVPVQAALRLVALPLSWIRGRPDHDEVAGTEVVSLQ